MTLSSSHSIWVSRSLYANVITLRSGRCYHKSVCRLSVTFVRPTQGIETFGNISSPFCTLAIPRPPCKILRRSSQGNLFVGGAKRKRGIKIERCHVRVSHLLMSCMWLSTQSLDDAAARVFSNQMNLLVASTYTAEAAQSPWHSCGGATASLQ